VQALVVISSKFDPHKRYGQFAENLSGRCREVLAHARRDNLRVLHVFPDWPDMRAPLRDCHPFQFEAVLTSVDMAAESLARLSVGEGQGEDLDVKYCGTLSIETKLQLERLLRSSPCRLEPIPDAVAILDGRTHERIVS
jgi:hypothetical protein